MDLRKKKFIEGIKALGFFVMSKDISDLAGQVWPRNDGYSDEYGGYGSRNATGKTFILKKGQILSIIDAEFEEDDRYVMSLEVIGFEEGKIALLLPIFYTPYEIPHFLEYPPKFLQSASELGLV